MPPELKHTQLTDIPDEVLTAWQSVVDIIARLLDVPAGLIMRINRDNIEVLVSSRTEGNPYHPGDHEHLEGSGLYCERVIKTRQSLCVPDATADPEWCNNPDVKLNMISYMGYPILAPDGKVFGTLCVLSDRARQHSTLHEELMEQFRGLVERDLALVQKNAALDESNRALQRCLDEIKTLHGIIPICAYCKNIRDDEGYWSAVEQYVASRTEAFFSHSICPACMVKHFPDVEHGAERTAG